MFVRDYPIRRARPASYNPRFIDPASSEALKESLADLGLIRAVIVTKSGTLIAGHQRTKAMLALGIETCPAFVLEDLGIEDEIRFNQLHNAGDLEIADGVIRIPPVKAGWGEVAGASISVIQKCKFASKLNEILRLIAKHGGWGSCVVTTGGEVLIGHLYAQACRALNRPLRYFAVEPARAGDVCRHFGRSYGKFSYEHLPKTTWAQSLAQMFRLRHEEGKGRQQASATYEGCVIPALRSGMRVLDFGAGQKDYVNRLASRGVDIIGVEFFYRRKGAMQLDVPAIHADIDRLCEQLRTRGLFDLVVCDSVLNSVDSPQAETDVLTCVNALCRPGGRIVVSGRRREGVDYIENQLSLLSDSRKRTVMFIDDDGFSAMYQRGVWLYQKFHRAADVRRLAGQFIGARAETMANTSSAWAATGEKTAELPAEAIRASLAREFDLPWPGGRRVGRSDDILAAYAAAVALNPARHADSAAPASSGPPRAAAARKRAGNGATAA